MASLETKQLIVLFLLAFASIQAQRGTEKNLKLVSEWKDLEFAFPSPATRQAALQNGQYITGRGVPIDVDVDYRSQGASRIFVTIPRFVTGIPVTFGVVTSAGANGGPIIQPYPNYESQSSHGQNCDGITSVFRVAVSELVMHSKEYVVLNQLVCFRLMSVAVFGSLTLAGSAINSIVLHSCWYTA